MKNFAPLLILVLAMLSGCNKVEPLARTFAGNTLGTPAQASDNASVPISIKNEAPLGAPFSFIENAGQWNPRALYRIDHAGMKLWFAADETAIELDGHILRHRFLGADSYGVRGIGRQQSRWNFVRAEGTTSGVDGFDELRLEGIYPGIDGRYYRDGGDLKYELEVAPGADPHSVRFRYDGADDLAITDEGDLRIGTSVGPLVERRPYVYQIVGGEKRTVAARFRKHGEETGFEIGAYDRRLPLTIDPILIYSSYLGGSGADAGEAIALDSAGNIYVAGMTSSDNFPTTTGAFSRRLDPRNQSADLFVARFDPTGSSMIYGTYIGGSGIDEPAGIAVRPDGTLTIAGTTSSTDFPQAALFPQVAGFPSGGNRLNGQSDGFLATIDPSGSRLLWSRYLGGGAGEKLEDIAINRAGNLFVVGGTASNDFPVTSGSYSISRLGGEDAFATRLNTAGQITQSTYLGNTDDDHATAVAVDSGGAVYVTGWTRSSGFPVQDLESPPVPAYSTVHRGAREAFVTRIRFDFTRVDYSSFIGGIGDDIPSDIALDTVGLSASAYITGRTTSPDFPDSASSAPGTWFVARLALSPGVASFSRLLPGVEGRSIQVAAGGESYLAGTIGAPGASDLSLVRLSADGRSILRSQTIGGSRADVPARQSVLTPTGDLYVAGTTFSANFPTTTGAYDSLLNSNREAGPADGFFLRYNFAQVPAIFAATRRTIVPLGCDTLRLDTFRIDNAGDAPLRIESLFLEESSPRLSIIEPGGATLPRTLAVGESLRVILRFASTASTTTSDTLIVNSNDPRLPQLRIAIAGSRSAPGITAIPNAILFAPVLLCNASKDSSILVFNSGTGSVQLQSPGLTGSEGNFSLTLPANYLQPLPENSSRKITIRFTPRSAGIFRDTLLVRTSQCDAPLRIPLEGRADTVSVRFGERELRIPSVGYCAAPLDTFVTLFNRGSVPLTILGAAASIPDFTVTSFPAGGIPAGGSSRITLRYTPLGGSVAGLLTVQGSPCNTVDTISLFASRRAEGRIEVDTDTLDFGVLSGCSGLQLERSLRLTLDTRGTAPIAIDPTTIPAPFSGTLPTTLEPGSPISVDILYRPTTETRDSIVLEIPYLVDGCRNTLRVILRGRRESPLLLPERDTLLFPDLGECVADMVLPLVLTNPSTIADTVTGSRATAGVSIFRPTLPFVIEPGMSDTIWIRFAPQRPGFSEERLTLQSEPCGDSIVIVVRGGKLGGVTTIDQSALEFPTLLSCALPLDTFVVLRYTGLPNGFVTVQSSSVAGAGDAITTAAIAGRQLFSGDTIHIPIRFDPSKGPAAGELQVVLDTCGNMLRLPLMATSIAPALVVTGGDFGPVAIGDVGSRRVRIDNPLTIPVTIESIAGIVLPFRLVGTTPGLPATIAPGGSIELEIEFAPLAPGSYTPTPQVSAANGCRFSVNFELSGEGGSADTLGLCISGDIRGALGESVRVRLRSIEAPRPFPAVGTITYRIAYDPDRLLLTAVRSAGTIVVVDSGYPGGVLSIREENAVGTRSEQLELEFLLLAGAESRTTIRLDSVTLPGVDGVVITSCAAAATIEITDDCLVGGLIRGKYANRLEEAEPNPARDLVRITWQQLESAHATLRIFDGSGREVLRPLDRYLPGGRWTVEVDLSGLSSGGYFYTIEAGSYREAKRMMIGR